MDVKRELRPFRNLTYAFAAFVCCAAFVVLAPLQQAPSLHTFFDGGIFLLSCVLALLLWDMGWRTVDSLTRLLAVVFAITALFEFMHVAAAIEFAAGHAEHPSFASHLRPITWPPASYILPLGLVMALWFRNRPTHPTLLLTLCLAIAGGGLSWLFASIPPYTSPTLLGMTRPSLALVPVLWIVTGALYWRLENDRVARSIALFAILAFISNFTMLYSQLPADDPAMVAHAGKFANRLFLLFTLMQMGTIDTARRMRAERDLTRLNEVLEERVRERTTDLATANSALRAEAEIRATAETKALERLGRLRLLQQTTHAIAQRQDLASIYQVVVGCLEDFLAVDFTCLCTYDHLDRSLTVARIGTRSMHLATRLELADRTRIEIDENGLSRCIQGRLVYEPDISKLAFAFPQRLARGGLRSFVAVPLQVEQRNGVFGVLIVARKEPASFNSADCEFLDQLGENVALASDQAQLKNALQHAYDELRDTQHAVMQQERLRALGQMASGIAHDINNAISPATLYVDSILDRDTSLQANTRKQLETVQRAIGDVAQTVARMGEFYRSRETRIAPAPMNVNVVLGQVPDLTRARWCDMAQARGAAIEMRIEEAPDAPTILAIESEIREALINLVFNAADAMPEGGIITVRARRAGAEFSPARQLVIVEVGDNGIGMDEKTRNRCLEPFFTTKGERGTGLGLAMVYGIAQRHRAEMQIESDVGKGTTIRLLFPELTDTDPTLPARVLAQTVRKLRLLLIDDDPLILQSLSDALEYEGHHVTCAHGGQSGIDMFNAACDRDEPFVVVLTDLGMPHVDGRQVAAAIKARAQATTVIMLTGWGQRMAESDDAPAYVDKVLTKPPNMWELRDELARAAATLPAQDS